MYSFAKFRLRSRNLPSPNLRRSVANASRLFFSVNRRITTNRAKRSAKPLKTKMTSVRRRIVHTYEWIQMSAVCAWCLNFSPKMPVKTDGSRDVNYSNRGRSVFFFPSKALSVSGLDERVMFGDCIDVTSICVFSGSIV